MGVILDPRHENERPADLQQPDPAYFQQLQSEVTDKGEGTVWLEAVSDGDYTKKPAPAA